jgi:predicted AAA+ superfamily ATPase
MQAMIDRDLHVRRITGLLKRFPVVAMLGARQVGKTTLAGLIASSVSDHSTRFDLESPADVARLADPMLALQGLKGIVVLDEVQRRPELFPVLRVLADRKPVRARFLVLGSAAPDLLRQSAESLAGRIAYYELPGLALREIGAERADRLWMRGGFPKSFLAHSDRESLEWRQSFIRTFLERDLPALGVNIASDTMRRFWLMRTPSRCGHVAARPVGSTRVRQRVCVKSPVQCRLGHQYS